MSMEFHYFHTTPKKISQKRKEALFKRRENAFCKDRGKKMLEGIVSSFHIFCCCHYTVTVATMMSTSWPHLSFGRKLICLDKISRVQYIWKMGIECPLYNIPSPHSHLFYFFLSDFDYRIVWLYLCVCGLLLWIWILRMEKVCILWWENGYLLCFSLELLIFHSTNFSFFAIAISKK